MGSASLILAGDVGGTKTLLALYNSKGGRVALHTTKRFDSKAYPSLQKIVEEFLIGEGVSVAAACFGVPGPVSDGTVRTTNLPWRLSEREISAQLSIPRVKLVNDLVATAACLPYLGSLDAITLHPGAAIREQHILCVVAPGTGLGQAVLYRDTTRTVLLGSEGGHADFAPRNSQEIQLLQYLLEKFNRVSIERLLSGPGIYNIYSFLRDTKFAEERAELAHEIEIGDPGAAIAKAASSGKDPLAMEAIQLFARILGSHAGNMMLTYLASGGIFLGGGIPPRIIDLLKHSEIVSSYLTKGRLSPIVEAAPLYIIKDDRAGLHGAAYLAADMC